MTQHTLQGRTGAEIQWFRRRSFLQAAAAWTTAGGFGGALAEKNGRMLTPAKAINHTDEELETLAELVGQRTAWQALGRTGVKDGLGSMERRPPEAHPAYR